MRTKEYRIWRIRVIRRDKKCVVCGSIKNRQAHHLNSYRYFKNDRYKEYNGVCLCKNCHINFHTNYKRSFRQKCTKEDFINFLYLMKNIKQDNDRIISYSLPLLEE